MYIKIIYYDPGIANLNCNWNGYTAGLVQERTDETIHTKIFTQTLGLARFPNNSYEAMKLTKGDVSQCPVFNFKKTLKKAIILKNIREI
jgi:hypothetical protein